MGVTQTSQLDTAASPFHTDTIDIGCPFQETSILASACALREDKSGLFIDETEGQLVSLLTVAVGIGACFQPTPVLLM